MIKDVFLMIFTLLVSDLSAAETKVKKHTTKQQLAQYLRPKIAEKINTSDFNITIENMPAEDIHLGEENLEVDDISIPADQRSFKISITPKEHELISVSGRIEWLSNIPVLLRPLGPNDIVNLSDIGYQPYPVDQLNSMVIMDANELIGKTAAHCIIKPGLPIERSKLKSPTLVKKGELIDIVYRKNTLTVSAKALATQDLAYGDTGVFEAQHDAKQVKRISAKVISPGTAEIVHGFA